MVGDSIANFINKLKTSAIARIDVVSVPHSNILENIAKVLEKEGFISSFEKKGDKTKKALEIKLSYLEDGLSKIRGVKRVSHQSKRIYKGAKELRSVKKGYGVSVISTPEGVISDRQARKLGVGGEVLFQIW